MSTTSMENFESMEEALAKAESDPTQAGQLLELLYDELKQLAAARLAGEHNEQTLQPTALVHEAYLRLIGEDGKKSDQHWNGRGHFFGAAAQAMRRILVENARRKQSKKRGENPDFTQVREDLMTVDDAKSDEVIAVHEALKALEKENPEAAELVELRFFGGLTIPEAAAILDTSEATVKRLWVYARAKLNVLISEAKAK